MIHEPLISICIPAFNAEKTLVRCVSSVLEQEHENYEVIIVDDGSVDNTPNICSDLAANYANVIVFHQENRGPTAARGKAVSKAKGQYVLFLDQDDKLEPNSLQLLSRAIEETGADVIFFDFAVLDFAGNKIPQPEFFPDTTAEINRISKNTALVKFLTNSRLGLMFIHIVKTDLANAAFKRTEVPHVLYGEDTITNISLYSITETFAYLRALIYLHIETSGSSSDKRDPEKRWMDAQETVKAVREFSLKVSLNEEMRAEVERGISTDAAMRVIYVIGGAHRLPAVRAKELFKSIRTSALFQGVRNKRGLELSWRQRIALMMLSWRFDSLLLFCSSLRYRRKRQSCRVFRMM